MKSFTVLCDDLTGSSVQSILLKERGVPVRQIIRLSDIPPPPPEDGEALVINCDTRRRSQDETGSIFRGILDSIPGHTGIAKRIDTTLRGYLRFETEIILKARPKAVALVVPAYPSSGRTTVGGYQLLNGTLLERTEVARDPIWPISTSFVTSYFNNSFPVSTLGLESVKAGETAAALEMKRLLAGGTRIVVADAMSENDIEILASAACSVDEEIVPVDPGPFTAALLSRKLSRNDPGTVVAIIGSTSEKTRKQLAWLDGKISGDEFVLSPSDSPEEAFVRLSSFLGRSGYFPFLLIRPDSRVERGLEERTARTLAAVGKEALAILGKRIRGILLSGGDTAAMFFQEAGATVLLPEAEIQPLMMGGNILDGAFAGLNVVTKGGLIGEEDGIYKAVLWLRKERE
jgi:uncharacterized protein YgbK (DUF1537 family)